MNQRSNCTGEESVPYHPEKCPINPSDTAPLNPPQKGEDKDLVWNDLLHFDREKAYEEAYWLVWDLALPQTLLQLGLIFASALTAAFVGRRMGPVYLDG